MLWGSSSHATHVHSVPHPVFIWDALQKRTTWHSIPYTPATDLIFALFRGPYTNTMMFSFVMPVSDAIRSLYILPHFKGSSPIRDDYSSLIIRYIFWLPCLQASRLALGYPRSTAPWQSWWCGSVCPRTQGPTPAWLRTGWARPPAARQSVCEVWPEGGARGYVTCCSFVGRGVCWFTV